MTVFAGVVVVLFALLGVLLTALTLPGIWIALFVALLVELWRPELQSWWVLGSVAAIALLAEVAEFLSSAAGSRKAEGSKKGMIGSIVGTIVGMVVIQIALPVPIIGAIIGGVVGAGLGAIAGEKLWAKRPWIESWRSGKGAAVGRALSMVVKTAFAVAAAIVLTLGVIL
ncbi:MAG: DUF456 domain-containing protein [Planctomycetota bacterium]